jgi:amidase
LGVLTNKIAGIDDPELFHDMPLGLQVVCGRLQEEKVLAVAEEVENIMKTQ